MRIKIESETWCDIGDLIRHYPQLGSFGFEIEKRVDPQNVTVKDANGSNITYECGCTCKYTPYVHVDTVEDIFRLGKAVNKNLVFHDDQKCIIIADR